MRRTARTSLPRALALGLALSLAVPASAIAAPVPIDDPEAKALFEDGVERYESGDLEGALEKLDASLAIQRSTEALFTKGQSLNRLGRCREAVPVYKEVLTHVEPGSEAEAAVKNVLVVCAEKMAEEDDEPLVAPVIDSDTSDDDDIVEPVDEVDEPRKQPGKRWYKDPYAPVLIGVGAIGIGVGGYYLGQAADENARQPEQYDEFAAKGDRVRRLQIQGGVILGVGGALLLTGAIRYAVLAARDRRSRTAVAPSFGPRWAGISVAGRF